MSTRPRAPFTLSTGLTVSPRPVLLRSGSTDGKIRTAVKNGTLARVADGYYAERTPTAHELAEVFAAIRPGLVFADATALQLHTASPLTLPLTAVAPPGVSCHDTRDLHAARVRRAPYVLFGRIPALSLLATVRRLLEDDDALAQTFAGVRVPPWSTRRDYLRGLLEKQYSGKDGRERLTRDLYDLGPSNQKQLRQLLDGSQIGADTGGERRVGQALRQRGHEVVHNFPVAFYRWDLGLPRRRTVVDIDGYDFHNAENGRTFTVDRWKANHAVRAGYKVLRFPAMCVKFNFEHVIGEIEAAAGRPNEFSREHDQFPVWNWNPLLWP